jgi:hypothetical protein
MISSSSSVLAARASSSGSNVLTAAARAALLGVGTSLLLGRAEGSMVEAAKTVCRARFAAAAVKRSAWGRAQLLCFRKCGNYGDAVHSTLYIVHCT